MRKKIFLIFTYLHKTELGQKLLEIFRIFLKKSTLHTFGYTGLDARQNISQFQGVMIMPQTHDLCSFSAFLGFQHS